MTLQTFWRKLKKVKGKADDLYRGSMHSKITAEPLYNTPSFIGPYAAANNTVLLA